MAKRPVHQLASLSLYLGAAVQAANLAAAEQKGSPKEGLLSHVAHQLALTQAAIGDIDATWEPGSYYFRGELIRPQDPRWAYAEARAAGVVQWLPSVTELPTATAEALERNIAAAKAAQAAQEAAREAENLAAFEASRLAAVEKRIAADEVVAAARRKRAALEVEEAAAYAVVLEERPIAEAPAEELANDVGQTEPAVDGLTADEGQAAEN